MVKTQIFEITKDFGGKTLEKVFVKELEQQESSLALREKIATASAGAKTVCVVAESAFSSTLMDLLFTARSDYGIRIYVIVKSLSRVAFEQLANNCIVREVPEISGNYLLCDINVAFFFDADLNGYALHDAETVRKLHDIFIYEFWNNASKEFVAETKTVTERTFDVVPVEGNEHVIIDRSALEEKPYQMCLGSADSFVVQKAVSEWLKNTASNGAAIYLDKQGCTVAKDWLLKTDGLHIIYTDTSHIPLCKNGGMWYVHNSNFDKTADNTGKLFAVQLEEVPVFANAHTFKDSFTYRESVGKAMFYAKDFSPVAIISEDHEECSVSYDYKQFKKIAKMTETEREAFFDKQNLLESNKLAASVLFTVKMTVKKLSKGAVRAPIYAEYENFIKQCENATDKIRKTIENSKCDIKAYGDKIKILTARIEEFIHQKEMYNRDMQERDSITEQLKNLKDTHKAKAGKKVAEKEYGDMCDRRKDVDKRIADFQKHKNDGEQFEKERGETQERLKEAQNMKAENEHLLARMAALPERPETVAECAEIQRAIPAFKLTVPSFNLPQHGMLYKTKTGYEYALNNPDADFDAAEAEMQTAQLENLAFVDSQR